ncbi:MAG: hypothetical protein IKZ82_03165 [Clostridia bacterium]|nr:hypothetical protein [Clostridia bacterium]
MKLRLLIATAALCALMFWGCTDISPRLDPGVTLPPTPETAAPNTESPSPELSEEPTPEFTLSPVEIRDVLGNIIYGSDHYERYISFSDIYVYEENGDTFVDLTAENSYPKLILCAVNIAFYNADGSIIASSSLQMPDGSFMLALPGGKTRLFARVMTDTVLTDKPFRLIFDQQTGVKPQ